MPCVRELHRLHTLQKSGRVRHGLWQKYKVPKFLHVSLLKPLTSLDDKGLSEECSPEDESDDDSTAPQYEPTAQKQSAPRRTAALSLWQFTTQFPHSVSSFEAALVTDFAANNHF